MKILAKQQGERRLKSRRDHFWHDLGMQFVKLMNIPLIMLPYALGWRLFFSWHVGVFESPYRGEGCTIIFALLYCFFARIYDAFEVSLKRITELIYSQVLSLVMVNGIMFLMLWFLDGKLPNPLVVLAVFLGQVLLCTVWSILAHKWYFANYAGQLTGIVYDVRDDMEDLFDEYGLDKKFDVQFSCSAQECLAKKMEMLRDLDAVFLYGVHSHDRNVILKYCVMHRINVYMIPRIGDVIMSGSKRMHMFHLPILSAGRYNPPLEYLVIKRAFDVVSSALGIVLASPIMLAVAIAIKLYDGGPVLYKQTRLTKDGKEFKLLKFRSMRTDAEKDGVARLSTGKNDDRITPVGRFIRSCRLDELPQLFNILSGSMSVVGPRPERPEIAAQYERDMPEFALRLQAKAGLTGYAQVFGKYNTIPYDKLQMDLMYIAEPSLLEDLRIIFATIQILFMKESTEGVQVGQKTAGDAVGRKESA